MVETREHTGSYYAATRSIETDYPKLHGEHRCDVVVVGAGFTGLSTTLYLAERGYDVTLIEANRVGWGASGRNGGQLIDGFTNVEKFQKKFGHAEANMVRQMGLECRDIVVERIEQYAIDCNLKFGYLDIAGRGRPAELRGLEEHLEAGALRRRRLDQPQQPFGECEIGVEIERLAARSHGGLVVAGNMLNHCQR